MNKTLHLTFKYILLTAVIITAIALAGCGSADPGSGSADSETSGNKGTENLQIVTTIFPEYDWVKAVLGEKSAGADVTLLAGNGVDMHSFQPSADDILKISGCDLFIYVGGESDQWVDAVLKESVNKNMVALDLLEVLGDKAKEEEEVPGSEEAEHEHDEAEEPAPEDGDETDEGHGEDGGEPDESGDEHGEDGGEPDKSDDGHDEDGDHHDDEAGPEYDEHVWLSLRNARVFVPAIAEALQGLDPANAETYETNAKAYVDELKVLDNQYNQAVSESEKRALLFGDRFPFRYMTDDYDIDYYAAFDGCSAETEASFETVTELAKKVDELSLKSIMIIEGSDGKLAETIRQNTKKKNQQILSLDSMQSVTESDIESGITYLSIMKKNLKVLKQAL